MAKKKVLLMGKAHSGKTSMRSIIFANYLARDTTRLSPTLDVEHHHVRFLGDLVLNLWDCGGQDAFYESYFERDRETIFRSVELLIYVFDIESDSPEKDFDHFCGVLEAMEENSPDARIFVLIHKMDLVAEEDRESIFEDRMRLVEDSCRSCGVAHFQCYATSIWNETLYRAWSEIVATLVPNINILETHLKNFCRVCDADEVVLFERATFLVVSHAQSSVEDAEEWDTMMQQGSGGKSGASAGTLLDGPAAAFNESDPQLLTQGGDNATITSGESHALVVASNNPDGSDLTPMDGSSKTGNIVAANSNPATQQNGRLVKASTSSQQLASQPSHHRPRSTHFDAHRFEKISNIIKQFKLSCGKAQSQFQGMQVRNSRFRAFIDAFTDNTYIMVIVSNPHVHTAATLLNIQNARQHFERFIPRI